MTAEAARRTPAPPSGTYLGMPKFGKNAKEQLANNQLRKNLRHATSTIRAKRVARVAEVPELGGTAARRRGDQEPNPAPSRRPIWCNWRSR